MIGLLEDLKQWSASKPVQPTGTTFECSELGCVASIFLPPVPERRSRQPPLLPSRDAQELGLGGPDCSNEIAQCRSSPRSSTTKASILLSGQIVVPLVAVLSKISGSFLSQPKGRESLETRRDFTW